MQSNYHGTQFSVIYTSSRVISYPFGIFLLLLIQGKHGVLHNHNNAYSRCYQTGEILHQI